MDRLQDIAKKIAGKHSLQGEMEAALILQKAGLMIEEYWGKKGIENVRPQKLFFNNLYLKAKNPVWAQEVQLRKHDLLNRLNQAKLKNILEIKITL